MENIRVKLDESDKMPGWKFSEYEMRGVPLRLELGPKDIEKNQCVVVRRDNRSKQFIPLDEIETRIPEILAEIQKDMLEKAREMRDKKTYIIKTMDEFISICEKTPGFIKAMWCGNEACEEGIKEKTGASARCIPFDQEKLSDRCVCCGEKAEKLVYWGKAY
jgi:prolyl-tRNA synthetase